MDIAIAGAPGISREQFQAILAERGAAPEVLDAAGAIYAVLVSGGVRPEVALAFWWVESKFGREGVQARYTTRNFGNVRTPEDDRLATGSVQTDRGVFAMYPTWAAGAADWAKRLTGPKYAGAGLTTVREVLPKYAPSSDSNDPDKYADTVIALATQWASEEATVVSKPAVDEGHRSPNCGGYSGARKVEAWCVHITDGTNSLGWLTSPVSQASANYLVRRDGYIYELVPPGISPWTNGDVQRPDLGNPLIAAWVKAGINPNTRCLTVEMEGKSAQWNPGALTKAQEASLVALLAWGCDAYGFPADDTHIIRHSQINDVTRHNCPGFSPAEFAAYIARAAALVGGGNTVPPPGPTPPYVRAYIDANGCAITEINWGGVADHVDGFVITDDGISVINAAGEKFSRSVTPAGFGDWHKG